MSIPLLNFIETRKSVSSDDNQFTFEKLKEELSNILGAGLVVREDDNVGLFYYDACTSVAFKELSPENQELANSLRSCFVDKETLNILATQYNNVIYNRDAIEYVKSKQWKNIVVSRCYEGTMVTVFNHKDKWYVSTRRCIDANTSRWGSKTYRELFTETMDFDFEELDKQYFYLFIIVHRDNNNIVINSSDTRHLRLCYVVEKATLKEKNDYEYLDRSVFKFSNIDEALKYLHKVNREDIQRKKVSTEGLILRVYDGEKYNSPFKILKLQTDIYQKISERKANTSNIYLVLLHFYQKDQLKTYARYFTDDMSIITTMHQAMQDLAGELLHIYHLTRNKNNSDLYTALPAVYKSMLYSLHSLYKKNQRTVTVHDVYHYLKEADIYVLGKLFTCRNDCVEFKSANVRLVSELIKKQQSSN